MKRWTQIQHGDSHTSTTAFPIFHHSTSIQSSDFKKLPEWKKWIQHFKSFQQARNLQITTQANQVKTIIYCMGDQVGDILQNLNLSKEANQYETVKLNESVCREKCILPSVKQTLGLLADTKISTKFDANMRFWQISLVEESAKLTTFMSPFGKFFFKRLLFGIKSA